MTGKEVYKAMVKALRAQDWKFEEHEEDLVIVSNYQGDDIPIQFLIEVDSEREVIRFLAPMRFEVSEEKRIEMALAVTVANYGLVNGSFDYDLRDGEIRFRLTTSFTDCKVGEGFFMDMMATALFTTDKYNDKFLMISKGAMSLQQFMEEEKKG